MDADKQVVFANRRELIDKIYETERRDYVRFVHRRTNGQTEASEELKTLIKKRIRFEDVKHPRSRHLSITNDQIPFVILKAEVWECSQGPSHRPSSSKQVNLSDHSYGDKTKRKVQRSKKKRCPVQIRARHIVKFPEYKIDGVCTARRKREISAQLRREFNLDTIQQHVILAELPSTESHKNHSIGEIAGHTEPLDWSVKEKIKSLCLSGHRNIRSIQLGVQNFVKEKLGEQTSSRRFTPTTADIRSHVYHAVVGTRLQSAEQDQSDVQSLVHRWQETYPKDNFFFRPSSLAEDNIEPLLFVCQTEFQRGLLQRYRSEMVLMDATYNFSNYNIPMYNLCIPTNVGYYVVASFITSVDRTLNVMEGLDFIKGWNPQWKPKHFIVDFDLREIEALEKTFAGVKVFLCDFHRSQAWQRWLTKNRIPDKNEVLASLSKVANADNEEILQEAMASIRNSVIYQENVTFRNWWEKKWIAEKEDERESPYCTPVKSPKEHTKEPIISSENERDERESPYCTPVKSPKEHTKEPIISFENERMQLRTKLSKKRRSCFWYQTPKRRKRPLYCVCQKSDDGRKYWQCEQCCQWFHPSCIGFKEIQEPRKFYCIECQTVNETESDRECEGEPAINDESKPITLEVIEESYSHIDTVVNDITACEEEPHLCEDQQHKFHHEFLDDHRKFAWKNRLMCRFGQKFISDTDYHELMLFLISERYTYYMRDPKNPVTSMRINMFKNLRESSKLYKVLFKNKNSDDYVRHSLIKDVLVSIVALKTGMPLELAYQKCCATEKSINDLRWQL